MTLDRPAAAVPKGCATLIAMAALMVVLFIIGLFVNANQEAQWEAESGTEPVTALGITETDSWVVTSAALVTNAEYHTTELVLTIDRKRTVGIGGLPRLNPDVIVSVGGTTCQRTHGRLYSESLSLPCNVYLPLERIREIDSVTVDYLG